MINILPYPKYERKVDPLFALARDMMKLDECDTTQQYSRLLLYSVSIVVVDRQP